MKKIIIGLILFCAALAANAMSFTHAKSIFLRLGGNVPFEYDSTAECNAYYNGVSVTVDQGMLNAVNDDNEMAFVLAHELGHAAGNPGGHKGELGADRYGVILANSHGFDGCQGARKFFHQFDEPSSKTHPSSAERIANLPC